MIALNENLTGKQIFADSHNWVIRKDAPAMCCALLDVNLHRTERSRQALGAMDSRSRGGVVGAS